VSSFPESRRWIKQIFEGTPAELREQILVGNPCQFWGLDRQAELTATPAVFD
jgi:predicted TIM-barrel fold metal-dependent hydrolase